MEQVNHNLTLLLESSRDWLIKVEQEPCLDPPEMLRFYNHFTGVRKMGYELRLDEPDGRHYHLTLVRDNQDIKTVRYERP